MLACSKSILFLSSQFYISSSFFARLFYSCATWPFSCAVMSANLPSSRLEFLQALLQAEGLLLLCVACEQSLHDQQQAAYLCILCVEPPLAGAVAPDTLRQPFSMP